MWDLIVISIALTSALTTSDSSSTLRKATSVSELTYEPAEVPLPRVNGMTSFQFPPDGSDASWIVDFIAFFQQGATADEAEGGVLWHYAPDRDIMIEPGDYMLTDQNNHVWTLDATNYAEWLSNG